MTTEPAKIQWYTVWLDGRQFDIGWQYEVSSFRQAVKFWRDQIAEYKMDIDFQSDVIVYVKSENGKSQRFKIPGGYNGDDLEKDCIRLIPPTEIVHRLEDMERACARLNEAFATVLTSIKQLNTAFEKHVHEQSRPARLHRRRAKPS